MKYPWYEITYDLFITQGDFIIECPVLIPPDNLNQALKTKIEYRLENIIVMSHACDLAYNKLEFVVVCPYLTLSEFEAVNENLKTLKMKETLRRGNIPGYHMLGSCELAEMQREICVVDFRYIYSLPRSLLDNLVKKNPRRLRLLPPYREHLSQAFARFFMRVGLPVDIPPFK